MMIPDPETITFTFDLNLTFLLYLNFLVLGHGVCIDHISNMQISLQLICHMHFGKVLSLKDNGGK